MSAMWKTVRVGGMGVLFAMGACAKPGSPTGGPEDRFPPQVVATEPDTFATIDAFDGPIRVTFSEGISERSSAGTLDRAVQISPESGEVEVRHRKQGLEVRMEGGFLPDLVYRVTVLPVVQDLFRNTMSDPFEFVFSTGAEMTPNAMVGIVIDRITGETMEGVRVTARLNPIRVGGVGEPEGPTHLATSDSAGVYVFRYVPVGRYWLTALADLNRNREPDGFEQLGTGIQVVGVTDTVFADLHPLRPDTAPAVLASADVIDSVTVMVRFDDFLNPDWALTGVEARVELDSLPGPAVLEIIHEREYLIRTEARLDSLRVTDSIQDAAAVRAADSLRAAGDSAAAIAVEEEASGRRASRTTPQAAARPRGARRPGGRGDEDDRDLPKQALYVLLADTLITESTYQLTVSGITNINGLPEGGGTVEVLRPAPPVDTTAVADSAQADTTGARPDTAAADRDTIRWGARGAGGTADRVRAEITRGAAVPAGGRAWARPEYPPWRRRG